MNAKNAIRASMVAMLMVTAIACQKSDDNKDNDSDAAPTVAAKMTEQEAVALRQQVEKDLAAAGYQCDIEMNHDMGVSLATDQVSWNKELLKKTMATTKPSRQSRIDALNAYITGMEAYLSVFKVAVPQVAPTPESPEAPAKDEGSKEGVKANKEEGKDQAKDQTEDKGDSDVTSEDPTVYPNPEKIENESLGLQACVELAKSKRDKLQALEDKQKQQAPEQKGENKGEDKGQPAPTPEEPQATEPKSEPTPAPEAPKA